MHSVRRWSDTKPTALPPKAEKIFFDPTFKKNLSNTPSQFLGVGMSGRHLLDAKKQPRWSRTYKTGGII